MERPGRDLEIHGPFEGEHLPKWTCKGAPLWAATVSAIESRPQQVPAVQSSNCCAGISLDARSPVQRALR